MKKWSIKSVFALVAFVMVSSVLMAGVSPVGTWDYKVLEAPYEYQKGELIVEKADSKYNVKFNINGTEKKAQNVKFSGSDLTFSTYVENEYITFKIKVSEKEMKGTLTYSEGNMAITALKKK
ncbi:hypothetical protein [Reichenbachiella sp. MALMAid0571]|uniref:hypothetical protein n=1 Tax=Reichenbachiella sp. MALMAid0571 TaxID=3143939 RepID=UPI0032DEE191